MRFFSRNNFLNNFSLNIFINFCTVFELKTCLAEPNHIIKTQYHYLHTLSKMTGITDPFDYCLLQQKKITLISSAKHRTLTIESPKWWKGHLI